MFTGLVEELGKVKALQKNTQSAQITIEAKKILKDIRLGDSIAVNGTCLTVTRYADNFFTADVMPETVRSTVLAHLKPGDYVNLERTLQVGSRLGGHMVSGHVDGVGVITGKVREENAIMVSIRAETEVLRYVIKKGSIAIDGISLTVVNVDEDRFSVSLIPHTAQMTTLGLKKTGEYVNLETDLIGKYVERLLETRDVKEKNDKRAITSGYLAEHGFL